MPCGHCGDVNDSVVAAHRNEGKGMAIKTSDATAAPLCYWCHTRLDQGKDMTRDERRSMWNNAYIKGMAALIETGRLVLK